MSTIHYKFRAMVTYQSVGFENLHVTVADLKNAIYEKEKLSPEQFDLVVENSHTQRRYNDTDIVPRNSSVIILRVPRESGKAPKIHDTSTSGIVMKTGAHADSSYTADFANMTEHQRISHIHKASGDKFSASNYRKTNTSSALSEPPPYSYTCNRCNKSGHWYRDCPLANIKRTTGIPVEELVETTPDDPHAMLHPSGRFMVQRMHKNARMTSRARPPQIGFGRAGKSPQDEPTKSPKTEEEVPPELQCPMCKGLLKDAALTTCCGQSFCMHCLMQVIMSDDQHCPGQDCNASLNSDSYVQNKQLRMAVEKYRNSLDRPTAPPVNLGSMPPEVVSQYPTNPMALAPVGQDVKPIQRKVEEKVYYHRYNPVRVIQPAQPPRRIHIGLANPAQSRVEVSEPQTIPTIGDSKPAITVRPPMILPTIDLTKSVPTTQPIVHHVYTHDSIPAQNSLYPPISKPVVHIQPLIPVQSHKPSSSKAVRLDETLPPGFEKSDPNHNVKGRDGPEKENSKNASDDQTSIKLPSPDINKLWETFLQRDEGDATSVVELAKKMEAPKRRYSRSRSPVRPSSRSSRHRASKSPSFLAKAAALSAVKTSASSQITGIIDPITGLPVSSKRRNSPYKRRRSRSPVGRSHRHHSITRSRRDEGRSTRTRERDPSPRRRRDRDDRHRTDRETSKRHKDKSPEKRRHRKQSTTRRDDKDRRHDDSVKSEKKVDGDKYEVTTHDETSPEKKDESCKLWSSVESNLDLADLIAAEEDEIDNVIKQTKEQLEVVTKPEQSDSKVPDDPLPVPADSTESVEIDVAPPSKTSSSSQITHDESKLLNSFRPVEDISSEAKKEEKPEYEEAENEIDVDGVMEELGQFHDVLSSSNPSSPEFTRPKLTAQRSSDTNASSATSKSKEERKTRKRSHERDEDSEDSDQERKRDRKLRKSKKHKKHSKDSKKKKHRKEEDDNENERRHRRDHEEEKRQDRKRRRHDTDSDDEATARKRHKKKHKKRDHK